MKRNNRHNEYRDDYRAHSSKNEIPKYRHRDPIYYPVAYLPQRMYPEEEYIVEDCGYPTYYYPPHKRIFKTEKLFVRPKTEYMCKLGHRHPNDREELIIPQYSANYKKKSSTKNVVETRNKRLQVQKEYLDPIYLDMSIQTKNPSSQMLTTPDNTTSTYENIEAITEYNTRMNSLSESFTNKGANTEIKDIIDSETNTEMILLRNVETFTSENVQPGKNIEMQSSENSLSPVILTLGRNFLGGCGRDTSTQY